jgi:hypothetical protein
MIQFYHTVHITDYVSSTWAPSHLRSTSHETPRAARKYVAGDNADRERNFAPQSSNAGQPGPGECGSQ